MKSKKRDIQALKFPLIEQAEQAEKEFYGLWEIPEYIKNNLTHILRPYQNQALSHYRYT